MRLAKAKHVASTALTDPPLVRTGKMAQILGIHRQRLAHLARAGAVPSTVEGTDRRYCVEDVIEAVRRHDLPVPPLRKPSGDYAEAMTWAFEAFSQGIWNVPTAPSGKAWQFWIWAREGRTGRNRLMRFGAQLAERDAFGGNLGPMGRDSGEQAEADGKMAGSDDGEDSQLTQAERCLASLDFEQLAAPFVDVEPEPASGSVAIDY